MFDLRNYIFDNGDSYNISTLKQNLQISFVNRLLRIVDDKSNFDNISKASAYNNLEWLLENINSISGNISTRQHNKYIKYIFNAQLNRS